MAGWLRTPNGIRTRVTALKGRRPRPLDDGGSTPPEGRRDTVAAAPPPPNPEVSSAVDEASPLPIRLGYAPHEALGDRVAGAPPCWPPGAAAHDSAARRRASSVAPTDLPPCEEVYAEGNEITGSATSASPASRARTWSRPGPSASSASTGAPPLQRPGLGLRRRADDASRPRTTLQDARGRGRRVPGAGPGGARPPEPRLSSRRRYSGRPAGRVVRASGSAAAGRCSSASTTCDSSQPRYS